MYCSLVSLLSPSVRIADTHRLSSSHGMTALQDVYTSPVSIKSCNHTFCSTCIRTHINQSGNSGSFCPKCRQTKAYDSELLPQPVLEVTALEWKKARPFIARLQAQHEQSGQRASTPQFAETSCSAAASPAKRTPSDHDERVSDAIFAGSSPRRSKRIKTDVRSALTESSAGSRSSPLTVDDDNDDSIDGTEDENEAASGVVGSSRGRPTKHEDDRDGDYHDDPQLSRPLPTSRRNRAHEEASVRASDRDLKADDPVQCPICGHKFTVTALNRHLDSARCYPGFPEPSADERGIAPKPARTSSSWFTKGSSLSAGVDGSASMANEKRLVRPQYNLRSERELRKLLDEAGLPTSGDREKMVERHRQWINIWNANLDSTKARRSAAQLRRDIIAWERTKASAKDHHTHVDRQRTTWVKSNKSQFDDLIQKAKLGALKDKKLRDVGSNSSLSAKQPGSGDSVDGSPDKTDTHTDTIPLSPAVLEATPDTNRADVVEANWTCPG